MFINIFGSIKSKPAQLYWGHVEQVHVCPLHFAFVLIRFLLQASPLITALSSKWGVHGNVHRVITRSWGRGGYEHAIRQGGEVIPTIDETSFLCHGIEPGLKCQVKSLLEPGNINGIEIMERWTDVRLCYVQRRVLWRNVYKCVLFCELFVN